MKSRWTCFVTTVLALLLLGSCKPTVPRQYIQPGDIEDILYDYHIADGMAQNIQGGDKGAKQVAYRAAVLKKYGVTQAEFDSSMVYYMRHADQLHDIYENISQRLSDEAMAQGASAGEVNRFGMLSANGDTADVWAGEKSMVLIPQMPYNQNSFSFVTDTAFHRGDMVLLTFKADFVYQDGMRDGIAVLAVRFNNDSIASQMLHLSSSNRFSVQINDRDHLGIKEIKGFFLLNKNSFEGKSATTLQLMFIHHIQLVRIHEKKDDKKETVSKDSTRVDSSAQNGRNRAIERTESQVPPSASGGELPPVPPAHMRNDIKPN